MRALIARLASKLRGDVSWHQRLGTAAGPWNATGAKMLAAHIAQADRPRKE
jgi:hypothetical protein